jgi:signal transduction histidine kinase
MSVAITLTSDASGDHLRAAVLHAVIVLVPIGVGMWAVLRPRHRRFGWLLIGCGVVWSLATLAESNSSIPYSIGRVAGWLVTALLIYLMLAFPSGRITARADRILMALAWAIVAVLYLPTALLVQDFPSQTPWALCRDGCPPNAFQLVADEPGVIDAVVQPLRDAILILLFAAVIARLAQRTLSASRLRRRMLVPVVAAAVVALACLIAFVVTRRLAPGSAAADTLGWLYGLSIPGIGLAFLLGLVVWELFVAHALRVLAPGLRDHTNPRELGNALRRALGDPSLVLAFRDDNDAHWVDSASAPIDLARARAEGRTVTVESVHGRPVAALIADPALLDDPELRDTVMTYTLAALDNDRLARNLQVSLGELEESRERSLRIADAERRRIERDLHDGAQQRLVAIGIRLTLAGELTERDPAAGAQMFRSLGDELDTALEEVRSFAHGSLPPVLERHGLCEALHVVARSASLPTTVDAASVGRHAPEIEVAVYFTCLEALQNAVKHARGATAVSISIREDPLLRFEVRDDGAGFDPATRPRGAGLANMHDRLAAIGGSLTVSSTPGRGTRVTGTVRPAEPRDLPARHRGP